MIFDSASILPTHSLDESFLYLNLLSSSVYFLSDAHSSADNCSVSYFVSNYCAGHHFHSVY